jgi:DNA repair protein SbcD/Mre11
MDSFSFIHASDLHLDTPFSGIGRVDPTFQQKLRDASLAAFDNLIQAAISRAVDFVVLAGDIYDGAERGTRAQARFLKGIRCLDQRGIRCFFIHGNHDPVEEGWSALRPEDFPSSAVLFDQCDEVRAEPILRNGKTLAIVHGISFRSRTENRNLSLFFPAKHGDRPFHIGLLHCNVGDQAGHGDYAPCTLDNLCSRAIDYWALGHIHKRTVLRQADPVILYPGNLQARRFDEFGPKGATLVQVDSYGHAKLENLELDVVRFAQLSVDVDGRSSLGEILVASEERTLKAIKEADGRLLVVRLSLKGRTVAHADVLKAQAQDELLRTFRDRLQEDALWLDAISVDTFPILDRFKVSNSSGFNAALVQLDDSLLGSSEELLALLEEVRDPLLKRGQFDKFLQELQPSQATQIIQRAESHLLALLDTDSDS